MFRFGQVMVNEQYPFQSCKFRVIVYWSKIFSYLDLLFLGLIVLPYNRLMSRERTKRDKKERETGGRKGGGGYGGVGSRNGGSMVEDWCGGCGKRKFGFGAELRGKERGRERGFFFFLVSLCGGPQHHVAP